MYVSKKIKSDRLPREVSLHQIGQSKRDLERVTSPDPLKYSTYRRFIKTSNSIKKISEAFSGSTLGAQYSAIFKKRQYSLVTYFSNCLSDISTGRNDTSKDSFEKLAIEHPTTLKNNLTGLIRDQLTWLNKVEREVKDRDVRGLGNLDFLEYVLERRNNPVSRRIVGNGLSLTLVDFLVKLHKQENIKAPKADDISALRGSLTAKTSNKKLKTFLQKKYSKFVIADQVRNSSTHWYETPPTRQDILVVLGLLKETVQIF